MGGRTAAICAPAEADAGSEGRISYLKHMYGWDRTRLDGKAGAAIWCGHGVFAHNLAKIGALCT